MTRGLSKILMLACAVAGAQSAETKDVTLTGWFSDERCAPARLTAKVLGPSNPECSKRCIEEGAQVVFISEQGRELLKVSGYAAAKDDLGYHVEITGAVDEASKSVSITTVKKLGYDGAACSRPPKKK